MVIGITINNIIRDHISKLCEAYEIITEQQPIMPINPYDLEKSFPDKAPQEFETVELSASNIDNEYELTPMDVEKTNFNVIEFMYMDASFEVFGRAGQLENNLITKLAELQSDDVDIILLNKESTRSKNATLFFLSKNNFDLKQIVFPDKYEDFYMYCDVLITDNPKLMDIKPKDKILIKVENEFNIDYISDFTIIKVSDIFELIEEIKNKHNSLKNS
jgi:hypothetical protein